MGANVKDNNVLPLPLLYWGGKLKINGKLKIKGSPTSRAPFSI